LLGLILFGVGVAAIAVLDQSAEIKPRTDIGGSRSIREVAGGAVALDEHDPLRIGYQAVLGGQGDALTQGVAGAVDGDIGIAAVIARDTPSRALDLERAIAGRRYGIGDLNIK